MTTESKTVNLSIGERLAAIKIFDAFKGGLETLRVLLEDVKNLTISEAEWEEAKLVKTPGANGDEQWNWQETVKKDVTLQGVAIDYLLNAIKAKSEAGEITLADIALSTLDTKLQA